MSYPHIVKTEPTVASLDGKHTDGRMRVRFTSRQQLCLDGWVPTLTLPVHDEPYGNWSPEIVRIDGAWRCGCGREARDHPLSPRPLDYQGEPFVVLLCDGRLGKL